jgi:uncharacterized protein YdeI (YjbR/CyaY-like superfamily)
MARVNPEAGRLIQDYLSILPEFSNKICTKIYELIHISYPEVIEDFKWRTPVFRNDKMVCGFTGFKKHVSLHFFHGSQMSNQHNLFTDDCSAQHSKTIKFFALNDIDENKLLNYLQEAFHMNVKEKEMGTKSKTVIIPDLLKQALENNPIAKQNFDGMAYTYRKEYAQHIADAKQQITKLRRLEKVMLNLEKGIKMHEQYKC